MITTREEIADKLDIEEEIHPIHIVKYKESQTD